jgi:hypothetical protein
VDKDRAIELAAQVPDAAIEGLGVEVRQVMIAERRYLEARASRVRAQILPR